MKAIIFLVFVFVDDPSAMLVKSFPIESRFVCEIMEGQLNGNYTGAELVLSTKAGDIYLADAECKDVETHELAPAKGLQF